MTRFKFYISTGTPPRSKDVATFFQWISKSRVEYWIICRQRVGPCDNFNSHKINVYVEKLDYDEDEKINIQRWIIAVKSKESWLDKSKGSQVTQQIQL